MTSDTDTHPKYIVRIVEGVILEIAAELHPEHLPKSGLSARVISDPDDRKEVATAAQAIRGLREVGLLKDRGDEIVEPTQAALRAVALLTQ